MNLIMTRIREHCFGPAQNSYDLQGIFFLEQDTLVTVVCLLTRSGWDLAHK